MSVVAYVGWDDFLRVSRQLCNESDAGLNAFRFFTTADYLIIDDVDIEYHPHPESDGFTCDLLMELVRLRAESQMATILTVTDPRCPRRLVQSVLSLALKWPHIHVGDRSLRGECEETASSSVSCFLGKGWLLEKLERLNETIERAMATLVMSTWQFEGEQNREFSETGMITDRTHHVLQQLRTAIWENDRYIDFIASLDFAHIRFHSDGTKTLE